MTGAARWTPDEFATTCERRADGSMLLRPVRELRTDATRLVDSLAHWAAVAPDRVLVARRAADGEWRRVTYAQMFARTRRIAAGLLATRVGGAGLDADRPLCILSGNGIEHFELGLAAMWAGIPYCPVSPAYSRAAGELARLQHVLKLLTPGMVAAFDTPDYSAALALLPDDVHVIGDEGAPGRIATLESLERPVGAALEAAHARTDADTIVRFLLTSGSTGVPKAVITTNRMCVANAAMLKQVLPFIVDEPPVLVDWLPWNHTFGGSHNLGLVLTYGGTLYIDDGKPTPAGIGVTLRNLTEIPPTIYFNVPKGFEMLAARLLGDAPLRASFYRRLRTCFFAGASLAQHTWDRLDEASLLERGETTPMLSGLGATETGPSVTFTTPATSRSGVIGLPAAGAIVKLAPVEEKFELRARGAAITPGYWRQPDLGAASLDEEGFYCTGDAVRLLDADDPTRGLVFDGRLGEDFKLANGTWVSVGPLRLDLIALLAPIAQDVVIAGLDRDYVSAMIIPDRQALAEIPEPQRVAWLIERLTAHAQRNPASTRCIRRACFLHAPLSIDRGEITDKGSVNQRAVLRNHAATVRALHADEPAADVAVI